MDRVAFIFARGDSKGIPRKNIKPFGGKPLIAWSIEQALAINRFDRVIVSTDSQEIAEISKSFGAEVPFERPKELATDGSPEWLAWKHALNFLRSTDGYMPETLVSLPTTAPLRIASDINSCLDMFKASKCDAVVTVTPARRTPYFNMVRSNSDETVSLVDSSFKDISRRQDAPQLFDMTTVCYVVDSEFVLSHNSIFEGKVRAVKVPAERAIDIDTELDFRIAEMLLRDRETQS